MSIEAYLDKKRKIVDKTLIKYLPKPKDRAEELIEAMRYSVLAGGKRLRPILMVAIADMFGKPYSKVLPAACAVEYIHTSTLILDDLPCMDNSDLRRGKPSLHKKFGESTAILASYSLMVLAFELLKGDARVIKCMSDAIGINGVCAGQYVDLKSGAKKISRSMLEYIHQHKTADLFEASCRIAGILSGASAAQIKALGNYGKYLGLAFQAYDDTLSINKTDAELGKRTKKDKYSPNMVNLFGIDKAWDVLGEYARLAKLQLAILGKKADILGGILEYVIRREK